MQLVGSASTLTPSRTPNARVGFAAALIAAWTQRRHVADEKARARAAIAELSALDDLALADIGINRGQIEAVVTNGR